MNAFSIIYLLLFGALWIVALPFLLIFSLKQKYRQSIPARFFLWKNPPFKNPKIWFHGASFGEVKSFLPFSQKLDICISATTQTGFHEAKKISHDVRYLPYEIFLPFWIKKPEVLVVSEAELWYMLFFIAQLKCAKTFLINARISDRSYKSYKRFSWFYKRIFSYIDFVYAQNDTDAKRLSELGAKNITVNGNIKTAQTPKASCKYKKPKRRVITLASTHEGEEERLLNALELNKNDMIIIAPRHPERFEKVKDMASEFASKNNLECKYFSEDGFCESDILVCDALGELINIYAITDITLLCGSFIDNIGGHNPLECAFFENIIISGKYIFNQKTLYPLVENVYFSDFENLPELLRHTLSPSKLNVKDAIIPIINQINKELS